MRSEESSVWYYSVHAESDMIGKVLRMNELKRASGRRHIHEFITIHLSVIRVSCSCTYVVFTGIHTGVRYGYAVFLLTYEVRVLCTCKTYMNEYMCLYSYTNTTHVLEIPKSLPNPDVQ